jgi:hypothetical protein
MSTPASTAADPLLLFNWEGPRPRRRAIVAFLGASVLLHAFCFYLFQIVYAPGVVLLPPPARVSLITADSEEGRTLLRWVDAEDPALASATQRLPEAKPGLPKVQHIPSYVATEPKLKHAPPLLLETRAPSSQPPGPAPILHRPFHMEFGSMPTRISFSEELKGSGAPSVPPLHFTASTAESPQAIRFRIGLSRQGDVRYCFPLNSSGDPALDEQARQRLEIVRLPPSSAGDSGDAQSLVWGIATVEWGNDVTRPRSRPSSTPAQ